MGTTTRTACLPTWGTMSVDDIYTDSAKGPRKNNFLESAAVSQ